MKKRAIALLLAQMSNAEHRFLHCERIKMDTKWPVTEFLCRRERNWKCISSFVTEIS